MTNAKTKTIVRSCFPNFGYVEAYLNRDLLTKGGIIKSAILNFGLERLLFQHPTYVNLVGVVEFFMNLSPETLTTKISL